MDLINIGILLTYLMIGTASILILADKYWKYFMVVWGLMLLDVALMVFGIYTSLLIPPIVWISFICIVILCPVIIALMDKNKRISTLYKFGGFVAILLITYLLASDEVLNSYEKYNTTASSSKQVGMGLITFYFLLFGAIVAVLYTELSKTFSK